MRHIWEREASLEVGKKRIGTILPLILFVVKKIAGILYTWIYSFVPGHKKQPVPK